MDDVLILAERPPVIIKKDTIEFNASAFKTLPTALVEDLLKKLPGVDVSKDGSITVNGKSVNKVLVEGKEFFGSDIRIATRNLPANIIDEVQVIPDEEQRLFNPNISQDELGQVINLKLKKNIKKGWFGKINAGWGNKSVYDVGGILNLFRDTLQVSLMGYSNNTTRPGFTPSDLMTIGGFQRSFFHNLNTTEDGAIQNIDGLTFGGNGQGKIKSTGSGLNINHELNKRTSLNLQYFFGQINGDLNQNSNTKQFIKDTSFTFINNKIQKNQDYFHQFGGSIKTKYKSGSLLFRPLIRLGISSLNSQTVSNSFSTFEPFLNTSNLADVQKVHSFDYSHEVVYNTVLNSKKGSVLGLVNTVSLRSNQLNQQDNGLTILYENGVPDTFDLSQTRPVDVNSYSTTNTISYSRKLTGSLNFRISSILDIYSIKQEINTFFRKKGNIFYDSLITGLSDFLKTDGIKNTTTAFLDWRVNKNFSFTPGLSVHLFNIINKTGSDEIRQAKGQVYPYIIVGFKKFSFLYRTFLQEVSSQDLISVLNNTNPLFQNVGNLHLKPTLRHIFNFSFNRYDPKKLLLIAISIQANIYNNAIIRDRNLDSTGIQFVRPINVNGNKSISPFFTVSKQYKFSKNRQFNIKGYFRGIFSRNYISLNGIKAIQTNLSLPLSIEMSLNLNDKIEVTQKTTYSKNKTINKSNLLTDLAFQSFRSQTDMVFRFKKRAILESGLEYRTFSSGVISPSNNIYWNSGLSYIFLRNNKGIVKLYVNDILKTNKGLSRIVAENYIQEINTELISRYFMLSVTYNLRYFGNTKVGGKNSMLLF